MNKTDPDLSARSGTVAPAGPVSAGERIPSLDILRGVAILGILVMNIYAFAMPLVAYSNPLAMGGTEAHNLGTWFFTHFFFDQKFLGIFAMLFGAGVVMIADRAEKRGAKPARVYYRRQLWLLMIGAMHGYLIWFGDILFAYAAMGMLAYLFRKRAERTLIIVGCVLIVFTQFLSYGFSYVVEDMREKAEEYAELAAAGQDLSDEQRQKLERWEASRPLMAPMPEDINDDLDAYRGSYSGILVHRAPIVAQMQQGTFFFFGWRILGLMLIGMVLMKSGVLTGEKSADFYRKLMLGSYCLGLPLTVFSGLDLYAHEFDPGYAMRYGYIANSIGSVLVALGHIGLVMLIVTTGFVPRLMQRFAAVGRMALSNYLLHSVILTSVFYGYGLGLYGQIPRFWQMGFVIAVVALQLLLSPLWLRRYRFGPVEWLWKSMSYWRWQPMRQA